MARRNRSKAGVGGPNASLAMPKSPGPVRGFSQKGKTGSPAGKQALSSKFTQDLSVGGSVMGRGSTGQASTPAFVGLNDRMPTWDGGIITSFPFINPLETGEMDIFQWESQGSGLNLGQTAGPFALATAETSNFQANYNFMLDNLARAYANTQNLTLTTPSDFTSYLTTWWGAASPLFTLVSLLNADGFNQRLSQVAQIGSTLRARIQADMERLQQFPIPPGILDLCEMYSGVIGTIPGLSVMIIANDIGGSAGNPQDFTTVAGWTQYLTQAETSLGQLLTNTESNIVRIVLAEYFGEPSPLPYPGVKMSRGLYDMIRLRSISFRGGVNFFVFPFVEGGANTAAFDGTVPIYVPRGVESWPLWSTLYRPWAIGAFNNVVLANGSVNLGIYMDQAGAQSQQRTYPKGSVISGVGGTGVPTAAFSYSNPIGEYYWAEMAGNSEISYVNDVRGSVDVIKFFTTLSTMVENSNRFVDDILQGKQRVPQMPDRTPDYNMSRIYSRSGAR
jgi:hypothetical protein